VVTRDGLGGLAAKTVIPRKPKSARPPDPLQIAGNSPPKPYYYYYYYYNYIIYIIFSLSDLPATRFFAGLSVATCPAHGTA
jgi:hypothetical protein